MKGENRGMRILLTHLYIMKTKVYIDFESRSQADIWSTGAYRYAEDPTTEILCLAWKVNDEPIQGVTFGDSLRRMIPTLNELIQSGAEFHAHNAFFERCIWKAKLTPIYGALPIPITQWRCTAAKAAAHGLPRSLEKCALSLGCKAKKDMDGNKLMRALCTTTGPVPLTKLQRLLEYCKTDVAAEYEIDQVIPDLPNSEQRVWFMDQYINDTGVYVDRELVDNALQLIETETESLNAELHKLTGGTIDAGTKRNAIKAFLEKKGLVLPNLQKQTVKDAINGADGDIKRILKLRQMLSLTSNAKYKVLKSATSIDGRLRDTLMYHGASTGRWSGKLVQLQNLVKPDVKAEEINTALKLLKRPAIFSSFYEVLPMLSNSIRGMFVPTPGYDMFISDFAAIEARVVMWLAGEEKGLKLFRDNDSGTTVDDIYVYMARAIYSDQSIVKKDKTKRDLGKRAVLGCGYGMGANKFHDTCEKYGSPIDQNLAQRSVDQYRTQFNGVPKLWYTIEDAARKTITSRQPHGIFFLDGDFLRLKLPAGRTLAYHKPSITADGKVSYMTVNGTTKQYVRTEVWGGLLTENMTQAVARDIMVQAMFNLIGQGFRILFTVHDEVVCEAPAGTKTCEDVLTCMRGIPAWANGCPINAECGKTERYKK